MKTWYRPVLILAALLTPLHATASGSAATPPSKATISGDFDGTPGIEIATITGNSVRITSTATGAVRQYTVAPWGFVQQSDLDGQPGNELLFTNLLTINGFAQPAKATVLTDRTRDTRTYDLGRPNRMQLAELEGQPGSEVLFTNFLSINGVVQPAQVTVLTHRSREIRTYDVGRVSGVQLVELEGQPGSEMLFTYLVSINGSAQPAKATVVTHRNREVRTYDVGRPNRVFVNELDGQPGNEVLFTNLVSINGFPQPARATVLTHRTRDVVSYDVGRPNYLQMVELDGQPGSEVLFTNLLSINGVPQPASASVVTHWRRRVQSYKVGSPRSLQISDFDGVPGNEVAFVGNDSTVIVTPSEEDVQPYSTGLWFSYQVLEADGTVGNELVFRLRNGKSLMVIHRIRTIRVF